MDESIMILEEYYKKERDGIPINCDEYFDGVLNGIEGAIQRLKEHKKKQVDTPEKP
jgi:hypothetical protein